jgi:hypothetical protein
MRNESLFQVYGLADSAYKAEIRLNVRDFTYPVFEQTYVWTFSQFIGAVGGVIGLLLGLDFTFFVKVVFTPLMKLFGFYIQRKYRNIASSQENTTDVEEEIR